MYLLCKVARLYLINHCFFQEVILLVAPWLIRSGCFFTLYKTKRCWYAIKIIPVQNTDTANGEAFMTYRAVLFDLDGTLINTLDDISNAANRVLMKRGFPTHRPDAYRYFVGDGVAELIKRAIPVEAQDDETIASCLQAFKEDYAQSWNVETKLYEGVSEMLDTLASHNMQMAILSNKPHEFTEKCVSEFLPHWNFQVVMGQQEALPLKPDPTGALEIARRLEVLPEETLYLGDTSIDMNTAKAASMFPVGVLWGFRPAKELVQSGALVLLEQPIQIIDILRRFFV